MSLTKGILKKTAPASQVQVPAGINIKPKSDLEARHLQTAIAHAQQIQSQKDTSLRILQSIESLSLLPDGPNPTQEEIEQFKSEVILFQPSDYVSLLEERNVNGLCGYTLCSKPPRAALVGRQWLNSPGERQFCSNDCAKKAMYVRAQLNETPAWERRGGVGVGIRLKDDTSEISLPYRQKDGDELSQHDALAGERNENPGAQRVSLVTENVVEKQPTNGRGHRVEFQIEDLAHERIDGYMVSSKKYDKIAETNSKG